MVYLNIFQIMGESFFSPLSSPKKMVYWDCLQIIYQTYMSEYSYGVDKERVLSHLIDYFEELGEKAYLDDVTDSDSRSEAGKCLRNLQQYGWIESEIGPNLRPRISMPNHAVNMIQTLQKIQSQQEMEYQSEISAIYSLLTTDELKNRPYPQVLKPVLEHTESLFSGLKQLNTSIRKYIDALTMNQSAEEIMKNFMDYYSQIVSKSYHRLKTSDNIARFRGTIVKEIRKFIEDQELFKRTVNGYMEIEIAQNEEEAASDVLQLLYKLLEMFSEYDDIMEEIDPKNSRYIRNAVERSKFLLTTSNDMEGKISTILQSMAQELNRKEDTTILEAVSGEIAQAFRLFPFKCLMRESIRAVPVVRKMTEIDDVENRRVISIEERQRRREEIRQKNKIKFSRKNITEYVMNLLQNKESLHVLDFPHNSKRDIIRLIYIEIYSKTSGSPYLVIFNEKRKVEVNGYRFPDFKVKKRAQ